MASFNSSTIVIYKPEPIANPLDNGQTHTKQTPGAVNKMFFSKISRRKSSKYSSLKKKKKSAKTFDNLSDDEEGNGTKSVTSKHSILSIFSRSKKSRKSQSISKQKSFDQMSKSSKSYSIKTFYRKKQTKIAQIAMSEPKTPFASVNRTATVVEMSDSCLTLSSETESDSSSSLSSISAMHLPSKRRKSFDCEMSLQVNVQSVNRASALNLSIEEREQQAMANANDCTPKQQEWTGFVWFLNLKRFIFVILYFMM